MPSARTPSPERSRGRATLSLLCSLLLLSRLSFCRASHLQRHQVVTCNRRGSDGRDSGSSPSRTGPASALFWAGDAAGRQSTGGVRTLRVLCAALLRTCRIHLDARAHQPTWSSTCDQDAGKVDREKSILIVDFSPHQTTFELQSTRKSSSRFASNVGARLQHVRRGARRAGRVAQDRTRIRKASCNQVR
jgi:hypothetical protein